MNEQLKKDLDVILWSVRGNADSGLAEMNSGYMVYAPGVLPCLGKLMKDFWGVGDNHIRDFSSPISQFLRNIKI